MTGTRVSSSSSSAEEESGGRVDLKYTSVREYGGGKVWPMILR